MKTFKETLKEFRKEFLAEVSKEKLIDYMSAASDSLTHLRQARDPYSTKNQDKWVNRKVGHDRAAKKLGGIKYFDKRDVDNVVPKQGKSPKGFYASRVPAT